MHVCQTRCRWGCSTNTFVIDCLIDSTFSSKSSKTINLIRDLTRDLQSTRFKIHGGYRERDGQSPKDGNPRVYYRINRKLFYRFALYFAAISRSAWAYLSCLSPIGVVYFIQAHAIDKINLSTYTYFEST